MPTMPRERQDVRRAAVGLVVDEIRIELGFVLKVDMFRLVGGLRM